MRGSIGPRKLIWTVSILILLILIIISPTRSRLFEGHLFNSIDSRATEYVDGGMKRALAAFAIARTFNAIVSVIQESELQLEPGGVGVSLALGQALDPVNDLVERFSWVMLLSLTSLGIQKVLIQITPFVSVQIFLVLAMIFFLAYLWFPSSSPHRLLQIGRVLVFSAILVRFTVPIMSFINHHVYLSFLEERHQKSIEILVQAKSELEANALNDSSDTETNRVDQGEQSWWSWSKKKANQALEMGKSTLDFPDKISKIKKLAAEMVERFIDLIVVFVLSTIVLPLLFLWGILKVGRLVIGKGFPGSFPKVDR